MKSLFETEASKAEWGKMNVGQMLTHCQKPFDVINGDLKMETKIGFMKKFIFSLMRPIMYNDKPWRKIDQLAKVLLLQSKLTLILKEINC